MKNNKQTIYDVVVIGGGASGMMAAGTAAANGAKVLLLEKNDKLGKKLAISGGGRCNLLNNEEDMRTLLEHYGTAQKALLSAFTRFGMPEALDFFNSNNLPTKEEDRKRVFPISNQAPDVVAVLLEQLKRGNVRVLSKQTVTKLVVHDGVLTAVQCGKQTYYAKQYILATGGVSRPETGSTGDGLGWLNDLGLKMRDPTPDITPLATEEKWVKDLSGLTVTSTTASFYLNDKKMFTASGSVLFTHFGLSGPAILNSASKVAELLPAGVVTVRVDCAPTLTAEELDQKIINSLQKNPKKQLKNVFKDFASLKLLPIAERLLEDEIGMSVKTSELSREKRVAIVMLLKNLPLTIDKLMGLDKAVVADGGLNLSELNTATMQVKSVPNLFVTGDLLDINRPTGGYSLQLCWTTGYLAGQNAAYNSFK